MLYKEIVMMTTIVHTRTHSLSIEQSTTVDIEKEKEEKKK
jgi:hypothetical protein